MTLYVADGEAERPVRQGETVVPVAADVQAVAGRRVAGRGLQTGEGGQGRRKHLALEGLREFHPGLVELDLAPSTRGEVLQGVEQVLGAG